MANIKLTGGNTWDTSGIYDATEQKTQDQVNSDIKEDVSDLKSAVDNGYNKIPVTTNGSFNGNGVTSGAANRIRTDLIPFSTGDIIEIDNGAFEHACGMWKGSVTSANNTRNDNSFIATTEIIKATYDGYLVVVFRKSDNSNISPSQFDGTVAATLSYLAKIDSEVETIGIDINGTDAAFGVPSLAECTTKISGVNAKIIRFSAAEAPFDGASIEKLLFKTIATTLTRYRFWIGRFTNDNKIKLVATFVVPTIDTKTEYVNGVDFDFEFPIRKGDLIGIQILAYVQNAYYGGASGSYNYMYTGDSKPGDELAFETKSYGISLGATYRALGINEKIAAIDGKFDNSYLSFTMDDVICIGDSLTRGSTSDSETMPYPLKQNYPYYLSRFLRCECENAGVVGVNTKSWYNGYYDQYTMANYNTFIIFLGTNGGLTNTLATDVDPYDDYNDFADTQTGYYCRIIEHILEDRPDAFIVLVNTWYNVSGQDETRIAIKAIGEKYQLPVVNTIEVMPYSMNPTYHGNIDNVHCSKAGYLALANLIRKKVNDYIADNPNVANLGMSQDNE